MIIKNQSQDLFTSSPLIHILIGMWAGILTGIGEIAIYGIKKYLLHVIHIIHSPHFLWMSPLANMALFAGIGLTLVLVNSLKSETISIRSSIFLFTLLGSLSLLLMLFPLDQWVALLVCIGPTIFISRMIFLNLPRFLVFMRKTLIVFLVIGSVLALTLIGRETIQEYQAIKELPPTVSKQAPNVLFIVLDTVRAQSLSLYGYDRDTTPRLKEFSKTGTIFSRAISTASWTLPSHASMFTGYQAHELSANWRDPLDASHPTLAEILNNAGYLTAGFIANLEYCSYVYGLNRGFLHYEDFEFSLGEFGVSSSLIRTIFGIPNERWFSYYDLLNRKSAPEINQAFLNWLPLAKKESRPFFAYLNYFDAHEPYLPPDIYKQRFGNDVDSLPFADLWKRYTPAEAQGLQNLYDASIAYLDFQIGELLDELQSNGILDNTIVIITSDHGEEFSEHGIPSHGHSLYGPSLHVPLIISFPPKVPKGKIVTEWVSLRDIPATISELVGLKIPPAERIFPGTSFTQYWNGKGISKDVPAKISPILSEVRYALYLPDWFPVSKGDMKSLIAQDLHYIFTDHGKEEIYNLREDPWETKDLSETPSGQALATCLRNQLNANLSPDPNRQKRNTTAQNAAPSAFLQDGFHLPCHELIVHEEES